MYELTLVLNSDLAQTKKEEILTYAQDQIKQSSQSASSFKINHLGEKKLSYPLKKNSAGDFWQITFTSEPFSIKFLNEKLKVMEEILRFLFEKKENLFSYETIKSKKGGEKEKSN